MDETRQVVAGLVSNAVTAVGGDARTSSFPPHFPLQSSKTVF